MSITDDTRQLWIDTFRGFLMCLVYLYHCEVFYGDAHVWSWLFSPIFLTGFFFISGYLFCQNWDMISVKKKIMQILRAIIVPYFIFMAAFLMPKVIILHYAPAQTIIDILLLRASWFVIAIGVVQLIYALTMKLTKKVPTFILFSLAYTAIGFGFVLLYREKPDWMMNSSILHSSNMPGCWPACFNLAFLSTPFFAAGILYRKYAERATISASWVRGTGLAILYLVVVAVDHHNLNSDLCFAACSANNLILVFVYFLIATAALTSLTKAIRKVKLLSFIGANSITFYFLNIMMLRIAGTMYDILVNLCNMEEIKGALGYGNYIIVTVIAVAITVPVVWAINIYLPVITGDKKAFNKWSERLHLNINW